MKYLNQLCIILSISYVAHLIALVLPFTFPEAIIALFILLLLLFTKVIKEEQIDSVANLMLANMAIVFVPAGVQIIKYLDLLSSIAVRFISICAISTVLVFVSTAYTVTLIAKLKGGK